MKALTQLKQYSFIEDVGVLRNSFLLCLTCCIFATQGFAVEISKPNVTITEVMIGFGSDPKRAEENALASATNRAINGDYKLKSISLSGGGSDFTCLINIEHKIFVDDDETKTNQVTVGYGRDRERAMVHAIQKAKTMISKGDRSISRLGDSADERAETRNRTNHERLWLKSLRFSKLDGEYVCYIKFEYLEDKKAN